MPCSCKRKKPLREFGLKFLQQVFHVIEVGQSAQRGKGGKNYPHLPPRRALGFWVAAVRELFEEVGVLLAVKQTGEPLTWDAELQVQLLNKRPAFRDGSLTFQSFLESEKLFCDATGLAYFSHWHTPATPSSNIDTYFFLAAMPEPQTLLDTASEITRGRWLAPDRALQLFNRGELPIAFSTFASLRTLADFDDVKRLLEEFQPEIT